MSHHAFDFIFGSWNVRNRRLKEPLANCEEWLEFDATSVARPIWDGRANVDEYRAPETPWGPIFGLSVRLYDEKSNQWSISWANRNAGRFDQPMIGYWLDTHGEFFTQELFRGHMLYSRFIYANRGADRARWEQAFSIDGGKTWETNWTMDYERVD